MKRKNTEPVVALDVVQSRNPAKIVTIDGHRYRLIVERAKDAVEPPFTPVTINGQTYRMTFDMDALCDAELDLMREGRDVNLLRLFGNFSFRAVREMFAVSIRHYHPEIEFDTACALVSLPFGVLVGSIIAKSMTADLPDPEPPAVEAVQSTEAA